ncbi:MAG TPA: ABC transporter transmembrane domain-containing protein [Bryobacteraceae bacterium]|nr:ABC transporter transmembrane domain-containing protein [Bryobacteraceae bacterium]
MKDLLRLLGFAKRYWAFLVLSVILMACVGAAQSTFVLLMRPVFDRVLNPSAPDTPVLLFTDPVFHHQVFLNQIVPGSLHNRSIWTMVAFAIIAVFLTKGICDYLANYLVNYVGCSAITDLRNTVFDKVVRQGAQFFEAHSTGRLMSSIMNDIEKIQVAVSHILADLLRQSFVVLGLLFVVLNTNWKLALVSLTVLPFVLVPTARIGRRIRRTSRRSQDHTAELNEILQEALSGHQVVKAFGTEEYESRRFRRTAQRLLKSNLRYVRQQALASPLIEIFGALTIVGLLTYARTQIKTHTLTAGEFTSFVIALLMMYEPVKRLTGIHNIFQQAIGASQKVFEYLAHAEEVQEKPGAVKLERFTQAIRFDRVAFRYPLSPNGFQLDAVDLEVKAGEVVAVVGPSGAGKTTLVNLVPRFYDVTSGAVRIDGRDVRDFDLASLRAMVGIVAQDTFLFNDTAANNIAYGRPGTPLQVIRDAAQSALADEFISQLPEGYSTILGERGVKLSGGQRQRIAIARALLKNAPILILDEATSHLDTESELLVQSALANLMAGRTVIVIAHRLSTIRRADKIVVLERGGVFEVGTHEELVNGGGIYQRLHELQFVEAGSVMDL